MTKIVKVLVLVLVLTVMLHISPAQACACGEPDWSRMSVEQVVSTINAMKDEPRIMEGERGGLPPAPPGYEYDDTYKLVPTN
jgi:hypothetical protein